MTRAEQFRRSRAWLKTSSFVITNSLKARLETVPPEERELFCYIQNKILITSDEVVKPFVMIPQSYWKDKLRSSYRIFIDRLLEWNEIEIELNKKGDEDFRWSKDKTGYPKSYAVPSAARKTGICMINFKRERVRLPVPDNRPTDAPSRYALACLQKLTVKKELRFPEPAKPTSIPLIREVRIREDCKHIFGGDFSLRYGRKVNRLYHRVLSMPVEGRCNLLYSHPLFEFDVKTCHPVLMLTLFEDPHERSHYAEMLSSDIYKKIGEDMGIPDREQVKTDFQRFVNASTKRPNWMVEGYPFKFYFNYFPRFAQDVLYPRTDLASYLQNFEAKLMVQELGRFCLEKGLYWIPMHDGFLSREDHGEVIKAEVVRLFERAVGFSPCISATRLQHP